MCFITILNRGRRRKNIVRKREKVTVIFGREWKGLHAVRMFAFLKQDVLHHLPGGSSSWARATGASGKVEGKGRSWLFKT